MSAALIGLTEEERRSARKIVHLIRYRPGAARDVVKLVDRLLATPPCTAAGCVAGGPEEDGGGVL
jgi:hypothetical protein